jgi:hypothetical protein
VTKTSHLIDGPDVAAIRAEQEGKSFAEFRDEVLAATGD